MKTETYKILELTCDKKMLRIINFLMKNKRDWCKTDIAKHSNVSRSVIYRMIKLNILKQTRPYMYQLNAIFTNQNG